MHYLDGQLKLSYSPMTIYEFEMYKDDEDIYNYLTSTSIYVIAKRTLPVMELTGSAVDGIELSVTMGNKEKIEICLLAEDNAKFFPNGISAIMECSNIEGNPSLFHSIILYRAGRNKEDEFVMSANLDRLIHLESNKKIKLRIKGDIEPFISYKVLYVGQCVGEHIFSRFKAHHALQDILIKEKIIPENYDKVNDLVLLPFRIESDIISSIDENTTESQLTEAITGKFPFGNKEISLDCEKALIYAMSPKYNKTCFKQYPKSKDGLWQYKLGLYTYRVMENIVLCYENNKLYGDVNGKNCSIIVVSNANQFSVYQ